MRTRFCPVFYWMITQCVTPPGPQACGRCGPEKHPGGPEPRDGQPVDEVEISRGMAPLRWPALWLGSSLVHGKGDALGVLTV